jgi:hypothetical protein
MSSTRTSTTGELRQERFCSAPEFEGDAISGLPAAKRIALVDDSQIREVLWFIQLSSLAPRGLQQLCDRLVSKLPSRMGTPRIRKLLASEKELVKEKDILQLRQECGICDDPFETRQTRLADIPFREFRVEYYWKYAHEEATRLPRLLKEYCLDPKSNIRDGVWFFSDLFGAIVEVRDRFSLAARRRLADTVVTRTINETLDFWFSRRRMVLIEGVAGIGRSESARAWVDAHAGTVRFVEVPSSGDDRSFFASIARELGVARGTSMKAQEIKVRIEEMLAASEVMLVLDEAQYLWGQYLRPRKTPDRILWIKSIFDAGTPVALVAHTDFSKWQKHYVEKTLWTDEQFERRLNRRVVLPPQHTKQDMLKIAEAHLPEGDVRSWKLLAGFALGAAKRQASGIREALESARYRANSSGRNQVTFQDIEAALIHDHAFLNPIPRGDDLQPLRRPVASRLQAAAKTVLRITSDLRQFSVNRTAKITVTRRLRH